MSKDDEDLPISFQVASHASRTSPGQGLPKHAGSISMPLESLAPAQIYWIKNVWVQQSLQVTQM